MKVTVEMIDAGMEATKNIFPRITRSHVSAIIDAALRDRGVVPSAGLSLIVQALEYSVPTAAHYPEPRERHARALEVARAHAGAALEHAEGIQHHELAGVPTVSKLGHWTYTHPIETTKEDAVNAFEGVQATPNHFVGMCFHLMQQCGGTLQHRGVYVAARRLQDCGGGPLPPGTLVKHGSFVHPFEQLG